MNKMDVKGLVHRYLADYKGEQSYDIATQLTESIMSKTLDISEFIEAVDGNTDDQDPPADDSGDTTSDDNSDNVDDEVDKVLGPDVVDETGDATKTKSPDNKPKPKKTKPSGTLEIVTDFYNDITVPMKGLPVLNEVSKFRDFILYDQIKYVIEVLDKDANLIDKTVVKYVTDLKLLFDLLKNNGVKLAKYSENNTNFILESLILLITEFTIRLINNLTIFILEPPKNIVSFHAYLAKDTSFNALFDIVDFITTKSNIAALTNKNVIKDYTADSKLISGAISENVDLILTALNNRRFEENLAITKAVTVTANIPTLEVLKDFTTWFKQSYTMLSDEILSHKSMPGIELFKLTLIKGKSILDADNYKGEFIDLKSFVLKHRNLMRKQKRK